MSDWILKLRLNKWVLPEVPCNLDGCGVPLPPSSIDNYFFLLLTPLRP